MEAILFDCDGTLIDSVDLVVESVQYAMKKVSVPPLSHDEIVPHFGPGADVILKRLIEDKKKAELAFEFYLESQREKVPQMSIYDGILAMLEELKRKNMTIGIVTGRHSLDLEIVLDAHHLKKYFSVVIADDQVKNPKPDPDGILLACKKLFVDPKKIFYVGDADGDVEAARKAGAKSIAAMWDRNVEKEKIEKQNPDVYAFHPREILKIT